MYILHIYTYTYMYIYIHIYNVYIYIYIYKGSHIVKRKNHCVVSKVKG